MVIYYNDIKVNCRVDISKPTPDIETLWIPIYILHFI